MYLLVSLPYRITLMQVMGCLKFMIEELLKISYISVIYIEIN